MKYLVTVFALLLSVPMHIFARRGDLEYLLAREYESAGTWEGKVLALVDRKVSANDCIKFREEPEKEHLRKMLAHYTTISGSGRSLDYTIFNRRPARYKSLVEFNDPFYYKHLAALDFFLKLEFIGILCHPENEIPTKDRLNFLALLWAKVHQEQEYKKNFYKKTQRELSKAAAPFFAAYKKNYNERRSEKTKLLRADYEKARLNLLRFVVMNDWRDETSDARDATIKCATEICETDPRQFFDFLEKSGFLEEILNQEFPEKYFRFLIDSSGAKPRAKNILRYIEEHQFLHKIPPISELFEPDVLKTELRDSPETCIDASKLKPKPKASNRAFISGPGGKFKTPFDAPLLPGKISEKTLRIQKMLSEKFARISSVPKTFSDEEILEELSGWRVPVDDYLRKQSPRSDFAVLDILGKIRLAEVFYQRAMQESEKESGKLLFEKGCRLWNEVFSEKKNCNLDASFRETERLRRSVYEDPERSRQMEIQKKNLPCDKEKMLAYEKARFFYLRQCALQSISRARIEIFLRALEYLYGNDYDAQLHACSRAGLRGKIDLAKFGRPDLSDEAISR